MSSEQKSSGAEFDGLTPIAIAIDTATGAQKS
jgi:hypothetical protein